MKALYNEKTKTWGKIMADEVREAITPTLYSDDTTDKHIERALPGLHINGYKLVPVKLVKGDEQV